MGLPIQEGYIPFGRFWTWYRIVGDKETSGKFPLLCLHGGPGMTHDYLETLEELAEKGRCVIFYDQLGSGNSDHPHEPSIWNMDLFINELKNVRKSLELDEIHLFGQSWGGFLAQEYMLTKPGGVKSLILADSAASTERWISEANRLRSELPVEIQATLQKHELSGTTDDPAYLAAADFYYRRHLCRMDELPDCLVRSLEKLGQEPEVYHTMWGPSEFHCTGTLQDWNIEHRLGEIDVKTLILSGQYDESTPAINKVLHDGIRNSQWVIFKESSHTPHLEETSRFLQILEDFLCRIELK